MQSKILEKKNIVKKNDEYIVDLTSKSIEYNRKGVAIDAFYVGDDMIMRPDLISTKAYGTDDEYDLILKYNGISNPFSINEYDLIFIPDLNFMYESMVTPENISIEDEIRNQYLDENKKSIVDPNKLDYDKMINNISSTIGLPPNISAPGDKEGRVTNNGNLIFGADVTKNK